jgi:hypothetical protein
MQRVPSRQRTALLSHQHLGCRSLLLMYNGIGRYLLCHSCDDTIFMSTVVDIPS